MDDDGLIQRFQLAVWPDAPKVWRNVDRWPSTEAKNVAYGVFTRMSELLSATIDADRDDDLQRGIPYLRFTGEAQDMFDEWRMGLEHQLRAGDLHPAVEAHLAKYRSLIPSLALLIHLADAHVGPVGAEPLRKALAWAVYLEAHVHRIYGSAIKGEAASARALLARIRGSNVGDGFDARSVYRHHWTGLADREDVEGAVSLLIDLGYLREVYVETNGRAGVVYRVNPSVLPAENEEYLSEPSARSDKSHDAAASVTSVTSPDVGPEDDAVSGEEVAEWTG